MDRKLIASRREALGIASLTVAAVAVGAPSAAAARSPDRAPPTREDLERVTRLYAGEFGGGRGR